MKLSTAIFLGCEKSHNQYQKLVTPVGRGKFPKACALGAALIGEYGIRGAIDKTRSVTNGHYVTSIPGNPWNTQLKDKSKMADMLDSLRDKGYTFKKHSDGGPPKTLEALIINLSDVKKWKRENVARFIQSYGY